MTLSATYLERRGELETYFDRTASAAWAKLTSDAPVSGIRATVRAGRDAIRTQLLDWLPEDLSGRRILDAGCGAGQFAIEAASRGAEVVAVDLSPTLVSLAEERYRAGNSPGGSIAFHAGDMFSSDYGAFDHIVAMDSIIHYKAPDMVSILSGFAARAHKSVLFTFAPKSALLATMHAVGKLFPKGDRAPAIEPVAEKRLTRLIRNAPELNDWRIDGANRVSTGFYISQAMELKHK
jgi:magnesium-protoporphyrin O-methyltransferase